MEEVGSSITMMEASFEIAFIISSICISDVGRYCGREEPMGDEIKLRVSKIEKSFPGVKALDKIDFSVRKGTVHALCGENGP